MKSITRPTLVVHGNKDIVVAPVNAFILVEHLPNAQLIMYPDSSHAAFMQHRKAFLEHVKIFFSDENSVVRDHERGGNRMTAEEILSIHTDIFNRALKDQDYAALEGLYADDYMLVRPDGSVLNKQELLQDLRSGGLLFHSIELSQAEVRMYGSTAVLTAESQAVSSRNGMESRSHFRLIAVYAQQGQSIKLVHFQSTSLP